MTNKRILSVPKFVTHGSTAAPKNTLPPPPPPPKKIPSKGKTEKQAPSGSS